MTREEILELLDRPERLTLEEHDAIKAALEQLPEDERTGLSEAAFERLDVVAAFEASQR